MKIDEVLDNAPLYMSWIDLGDLSLDDKMTFIEECILKGNLHESNDEDKREFFLSLFDLSDIPIKNKKYIVSPLVLAANRIMRLGDPAYLEFLYTDARGMNFRSRTQKPITYPPKGIRDRAVFNTFTFSNVEDYDNFRMSLALKFGHELPEIQLDEHIVKVGNKYRLVSKKTGKNLGTYPTRVGAEKREKQVQYFKHH